MANIIVSKEQLKEQSIRVYDGITTVYERTGEEESLDLSELVPKFNDCYAVNNSTVAYVLDNELWVTPYLRSVVLTLKMMQFKQSEFYVPFSNGDYPKEEKERWSLLREHSRIKLHEDMQQQFKNFCLKFSISAGIKELSDEVLKKCFKIPSNGFKVVHRYYEDYVYPLVDEWSDYSKVEFCLGHFCMNNGIIVFVDNQGNSWLAKGYKILKVLQDAGYTERSIFVPLSNGEDIQDEYLRNCWKNLEKFN